MPDGIYYAIQIYGAYLLLVALHEGSHLIAAHYVGYRWYDCYIGPLRFTRTQDGVRLNFSGKLVNGKVLIKKNGKRSTIRLDVIVFLAGVIANIFAGAVLLAVFLLLPSASKNAAWLLFITAIMSLYLGLLNLVPFYSRNEHLASDGLQVIKLWWQRHKAKQPPD